MRISDHTSEVLFFVFFVSHTSKFPTELATFVSRRGMALIAASRRARATVGPLPLLASKDTAVRVVLDSYAQDYRHTWSKRTPNSRIRTGFGVCVFLI